ncbi:MAG: glycyl-radical enzyme activating protein [Acidobacteriota bacterium]|nr:MAG: glycyl-radical enzyme activating protein [Acidobacteriota bacterium]
MKAVGTVFDIRKFSVNDGPGIRTTVFLKGCPLSCAWCHNPESQLASSEVFYRPGRCIHCGDCVDVCPVGANRLHGNAVQTDLTLCLRCGTCGDHCPAEARELVGREMSVAEVMQTVEEDRIFYDESGGGVTFSGGEPLMQPLFLMALLEAAGESGVHRVVDTSGHARPETLLEVARRTDLFLFDIKLMDPVKHQDYTGVSSDLILENLRLVTEGGSLVSIRIPLVPGVNDDERNLKETVEFVSTLKGVQDVCLLPFHTAAEDKHRRFSIPYRLAELPEVSEGQMQTVRGWFEEAGLVTRIGG